MALGSIVLLLGACEGGGAGAGPTPAAAAKSQPAGEPLMAILEPGGYGQVAAAHNKLALVRT
ncbi:MAG: phosphoribosylglycinamide synthetase, partial [Candidatus Dormibacteraeota bacterium]|nr:phosphoribosylglycinamide synthetase [Candidatus Dormibacteraeota bacterium]